MSSSVVGHTGHVATVSIYTIERPEACKMWPKSFAAFRLFEPVDACQRGRFEVASMYCTIPSVRPRTRVCRTRTRQQAPAVCCGLLAWCFSALRLPVVHVVALHVESSTCLSVPHVEGALTRLDGALTSAVHALLKVSAASSSFSRSQPTSVQLPLCRGSHPAERCRCVMSGGRYGGGA